MQRIGTCYHVRDAELNAVISLPDTATGGFPHNSTGLEHARRWAADKSTAGRELHVVEIVNDVEEGIVGRFRDGDEVQR